MRATRWIGFFAAAVVPAACTTGVKTGSGDVPVPSGLPVDKSGPAAREAARRARRKP